MPHLINLIQNSAKIMALSGVVAIRFIIEVFSILNQNFLQLNLIIYKIIIIRIHIQLD
jgi:hypothetical protein